VTVWTDPDFDPAAPRVLLRRVLEIPTPRWTAYDAAYFKVTMDPKSADDDAGTAFTSPIWYTPAGRAEALIPTTRTAMRLRRLLSEPLLHSCCWAARCSSSIDDGAGPDQQQSNCRDEERGGRPRRAVPGERRSASGVAELNALVEAYVRDEILYREGVTVGLDRDDLV
jgi:hypothetical protein